MKDALGALVLGAAAALLCQPPVGWWWLMVPLFAAIWWLWHRSARPFLTGWLAGVGYFAGAVHWVAEAFLVDAATFGWMIPFAIGGLAAGLALFWGLAFRLAKALPLHAAASLPLAWTGAEWLRGNALTGFPWALPGTAYAESPLLPSAAVWGAYGLSALTLIAAGLLGWAVARRSGAAGALALLPLAALLAGALWPTGPQGEAPGLRVGIVQPNVPQREKWRADLARPQLDALLEATASLTARGADVVVWPEAAIPYRMGAAPGVRALAGEALGAEAVLLAGALRIEGGRAYNALMAIGPDGARLGDYDKRHLVPFGEYLPFDETLTGWGLRAMVTLPGGMSAGDEAGRVTSVPGLPPFAAMICYEAIFPAEVMSTRDPRPAWMVQVTNDAWFGSSAGPWQHLAQARMRAAERGLPLVRAANTGVSALIGPRGEVIEALGLEEAGTLLVTLPGALPATPYARVEDGVLILLVLLTSAAAWVAYRRRDLNRYASR